MDRLNKLDDRLGMGTGIRPGETRKDYLGRIARRRFVAYADPSVYRELVELRERVDDLEARLAALERTDSSGRLRNADPADASGPSHRGSHRTLPLP